MRIADRTPFRSDDGQISLFDRTRGTIKYGINWYPQICAQEYVISKWNEILDRKYILLHNFFLHETEIRVPLILIGPPGIFLIFVWQKRGNYLARNNNWSSISGGKFHSITNNPIKRAVMFGQVLQSFLDRKGVTDNIYIEPILVASDPKTQIEWINSPIRVVHQSGISEFAKSLKEKHTVLTAEKIADIALVIIKGSSELEPLSSHRVEPEFQAVISEQLESNFQNPLAGNKSLPLEDIVIRNSNGPVSTIQPSGVKDNFNSTNELHNPGWLIESSPVNDENLKIQSFPQADLMQELLFSKDGKRSESFSSQLIRFREFSTKKIGLFGFTLSQFITLGLIVLVWIMLVFGFIIYINR